MKKIIRKNTFETASSSVHTLVFSDEGLEESKLEIKPDGYIHMRLGEFGKEYNKYFDQYEKLQYLLSFVADNCYGDIEDMYHNWDFKEIEEAIIEHTGAKGIRIDGSIYDAAIDHQSVDSCAIRIWHDEVKSFVFNKYVGLQTDCD